MLTAGCAGGRRVECHLPVTRAAVTGTAVKADVTGLVGGHSGTEIHKGRANAIALLGRWLTLLTENGVDYTVLALSGGAKENVIPKESSVTLVLPTGITEDVRAAAAQFAAQMKAEYGTADPEICLQLTEQGCGGYQALDGASVQRLRKALLLMPWGVQAMSMDVPGLVETSLNLGVAELDDSEAILRFAIRSSVPSAKELLSCKLQTLAELLGGTVRFHGDYPAWTYARESALLCTRHSTVQSPRSLPFMQVWNAVSSRARSTGWTASPLARTCCMSTPPMSAPTLHRWPACGST